MPTTEEIIPTEHYCAHCQSLKFEVMILIIVIIFKSMQHHDYQGKRKCDQYWPETGSQVYGLIDVLMLREEARLIIIIIIKLSI